MSSSILDDALASAASVIEDAFGPSGGHQIDVVRASSVRLAGTVWLKVVACTEHCLGLCVCAEVGPASCRYCGAPEAVAQGAAGCNMQICRTYAMHTGAAFSQGGME